MNIPKIKIKKQRHPKKNKNIQGVIIYCSTEGHSSVKKLNAGIGKIYNPKNHM